MAETNSNATVTLPPELFTQACEAYFGHRPKDVIAPTEWMADTMSQLEALFRAIAKEAEQDRNPSGPAPGVSLLQIKALADAGAYLAMDIANLGGLEHEERRDHLKAAGIA